MTSRSSLDPPDWPEFRRQAHRMLDDIVDYLEHIRERPVWQPIPDDVRGHFRAAVPAQPTELAEVHREFMETILPYAVGNAHPGFMAYVHGGGTAVGMVAEMLAGGLNANCGGRDHVPIEVERQIVAWLRELFRFPATASGVFVTGTSMANFIGVLVARTAALGAATRRRGIASTSRRLVAYSSAAAHGCVPQALDMCGLGTSALRHIPVNERHQIDLQVLAEAITADRQAGLSPFLIVGTAGSVDVGAIDDLTALADLAKREKMWFHVDGAFGALGILARDIAPLLAGIERADSIALDFHKWGQVPYDAGFILVRDGILHQNAFNSPQTYLRRETRGLAGGSPWPCDFGPDLSRGFRALKTWFTLKTYGTEQIGAAISETCGLARYLGERVAATSALELAVPVQLNIVCFRYRCAESDRVNGQIVVDLQEGGTAAPSTTTLDGRLAIRAAIVNHRTERRDMDALIENVLRLGDAAARRNTSSISGKP